MTDVRLVTCAVPPAPDPDTPILASALRDAGMQVDIADWRDQSVDWGSARITVLRSPWDYVDAVDDFVAWARRVSEATALWNPAALVAWNVHKSYLLDLHTRGAPIVPTVLMLGGSAASLDGICDAQGWNTVVVKPAVGIGAHGSGRFDVGDPRAQHHLDALLERGDVLVQPFVSSVTSVGEHSVFVLDGAVTHAVRKRPDTGDYRVQENWGGQSELVDPPPGAAELAARVLGVLPAPTLYARVDLLAIDGLWHVLEVEVTEPSLWLDAAGPAATRRLAAGIVARLD